MKNWRAEKRYTKRLGKKLQKLRFFEDCNYHVASVTEVSFRWNTEVDGDVDGTSLFTGKGTSCSLRHCNPVPLTKYQAMERLAYFKEQGFDNYLRKYIYLPMDDETWQQGLVEIHEFRNIWRGGEI